MCYHPLSPHLSFLFLFSFLFVSVTDFSPKFKVHWVDVTCPLHLYFFCYILFLVYSMLILNTSPSWLPPAVIKFNKDSFYPVFSSSLFPFLCSLTEITNDQTFQTQYCPTPLAYLSLSLLFTPFFPISSTLLLLSHPSFYFVPSPSPSFFCFLSPPISNLSPLHSYLSPLLSLLSPPLAPLSPLSIYLPSPALSSLSLLSPPSFSSASSPPPFHSGVTPARATLPDRIADGSWLVALGCPDRSTISRLRGVTPSNRLGLGQGDTACVLCV